MTPRERWLTVLNGGVPDRVPVDYRATPEATAKLLKHLGVIGVAFSKPEIRRTPVRRPAGRPG